MSVSIHLSLLNKAFGYGSEKLKTDLTLIRLGKGKGFRTVVI